METYYWNWVIRTDYCIIGAVVFVISFYIVRTLIVLRTMEMIRKSRPFIS